LDEPAACQAQTSLISFKIPGTADLLIVFDKLAVFPAVEQVVKRFQKCILIDEVSGIFLPKSRAASL